MPFFSIPYLVTYDYEILFMFVKVRTSIRVREWNFENSKYKKLTARGQIKDAEYINGTQNEGRMTRARAAALFPEEEFPPEMDDADLLALLSEHDQVQEQEKLDEKISDQEFRAILEDFEKSIDETKSTEQESNDQTISFDDQLNQNSNKAKRQQFFDDLSDDEDSNGVVPTEPEPTPSTSSVHKVLFNKTLLSKYFSDFSNFPELANRFIQKNLNMIMALTLSDFS